MMQVCVRITTNLLSSCGLISLSAAGERRDYWVYAPTFADLMLSRVEHDYSTVQLTAENGSVR